MGQLVDKPGEQKGHQVAGRAGDHGENEGVFQCGDKNIVVYKQADVVLKLNVFRCFQILMEVQLRNTAIPTGRIVNSRYTIAYGRIKR